MRGATRVGAIRSMSASFLRMSPGSDRNTGPVGGASAVLAARCTSSGRSCEAMHLARPFHSGRASGRQVGRQDRLGAVEVRVVLAGGDQDRRAGLLRVVEHAHRVAEAGRDVQVDHRELAGGLRVAVGHRHHGGLLQAEHVADVVVDREARPSAAVRWCPDCRRSRSTPSCFSSSRNARFPDMTGKVSSSLVLR